MDLLFPALTSSRGSLRLPVVQLYIAGQRRMDAFVSSLVLDIGAGASRAQIEFKPRSGQRPWALYNSVMCFENDLVEIIIPPHGLIWRGTIAGRDGDANSLTYTAIDLGGKLNRVFLPHDYNIQDEVTKVRKWAYTVQQIAADGWSLYSAWHDAMAPDDPTVSIDLDTFPAIVPREARVTGQPFLDGLQAVLETIDYRYRMRIDHEADGSILRAYLMGTGRPRQIIRATDQTQAYDRQPGGASLVEAMARNIDAQSVATHIYAEGDTRLFETALAIYDPSQGINGDWNEVANDYTPEEGHTIKEFVTTFERDTVINAWDKYTKQRIDLKQGDNGAPTKIVNPFYRPKYESVCTRFAVPLIDDTFRFNDNENYPLQGELARQVKLESECIQTFNGQPVSQFVVYKRQGDSTYYVQRDGFSVKSSKVLADDGVTWLKDKQVVEFSKPFVDSASNIVAKGAYGGLFISYNSTDKTSVYQINKVLPNLLTDLIDPTWIGSSEGVWLILGEMMGAYEIAEVGIDSVTVKGNLTDAGVLDGEGNPAKGNQWMIYHGRVTPLHATGQSGVGSKGKYQINSGGSETIDDAYAGMTLVLGDYDFSKLGWITKPADLKHFPISQSSGKYVYVDGAEDLTGLPAEWQIVKIDPESKRPFEKIWLNTAWQSVQKLAYQSADLNEDLRNKNIIYRQNQDFKWQTLGECFILQPVEGSEDKFTATLNPTNQEIRKDLTTDPQGTGGLQTWALQQVSGMNNPIARHEIQLAMMDLGMKIGDHPIDTYEETGETVIGMTFDFTSGQHTITAASRD